jgi:acetyl esterase
MARRSSFAIENSLLFVSFEVKSMSLRIVNRLFFQSIGLGLLLLFECQPIIGQEKSVEPPLDIQSKAFVAALAEQKGPGFHEMPPAEARKAFADLTPLFGTGPDDVSVQDQEFGTVPVRIYKPKDAASEPSVDLPVVIYFHGGGWVLGSIETHDALCRRLCSESKAAVVSVEYRLAPEHPFPAPLDDCYDATQYISNHAHELGLDAKRLVVAGDSAGGNLAAAVAFKAKNTKGPSLRAQVLIYPAIDSDCASKTYSSYASGYGLTRDSMQWYWKQYVGDRQTGVYASPSKANSFTGMPETIIITAQYDILREEGETFAKKLKDAGVVVNHQRYDGVIHGFIHFAGAFDQGKKATTNIADQLKAMFAKLETK